MLTDTATTMDTLDERLALQGAELLKSALEIARLRAEDSETVAAIDGSTAARLVITAVRESIAVELFADIDGVTRRISAATFREEALQ